MLMVVDVSDMGFLLRLMQSLRGRWLCVLVYRENSRNIQQQGRLAAPPYIHLVDVVSEADNVFASKIG